MLSDGMKLGLAKSDGLWFGVLVDHKDQLVSSGFSTTQEALNRSLSNLGRKLTSSKMAHVTHHPLANSMVDLYHGRDVKAKVRYNRDIISGFQEKVYGVLDKIPKGRVTSYGMIAAAIGSGPRAVGTAVATNPWSLFVPCHRVVPSTLTVGNYGMCGSLNDESSKEKKELLKREGVVFQQDKILPTSLWKPRED